MRELVEVLNEVAEAKVEAKAKAAKLPTAKRHCLLTSIKGRLREYSEQPKCESCKIRKATVAKLRR